MASCSRSRHMETCYRLRYYHVIPVSPRLTGGKVMLLLGKETTCCRVPDPPHYFIFSIYVLPWNFPLSSMEGSMASMEGSMEVGGNRCTSMENSMEVCESRCTSMEVSGSCHGNTWMFPLSVGVDASIASINCSLYEYSVDASVSFHTPLCASTRFLEYHKLPPASTRLL